MQEPAELDPRLTELYGQRDTLYEALRNAHFDLETGKLSPEDYERQSMALKQQAAEVLKAIDQLQETLIPPELNDQAEAVIADARRRGEGSGPVAAPPVAAPAEPGGEGYCPQCGHLLQPGDQFCGHCGRPIP